MGLPDVITPIRYWFMYESSHEIIYVAYIYRSGSDGVYFDFTASAAGCFQNEEQLELIAICEAISWY